MREIIVIGNPSWKPGLAGLVASNIVEAYARTVFVWGRSDDGTIKGSCRSDGTVNLVALMSAVSGGVFIDIGGHEQAGGFSVAFDSIHALEDELVLAYQNVRYEKREEKYRIDAVLTLNEVSFTTWNIIDRFAPFGVGNPKPIFLFECIRVTQVKKFGKEGAHLELGFENSRMKAIAFFAEEKYAGLVEGDTIDLVATMELNTFRGKRELRLRIVEVKKLRDATISNDKF